MELQGRNLTTNDTGDDVRLLHVELMLLGKQIDSVEVAAGEFGATTEAAAERPRAPGKYPDLR